MDKTIKKRNIKIFILCKKGVDHIVVGRIFKLSKSTINFIYNRLTGEKAIIKRKLSDAIKEIENFILIEIKIWLKENWQKPFGFLFVL